MRSFIPKNQSKNSILNAKKPKVNLDNVKSDYAQSTKKFTNDQQRLFDLDPETRRRELDKMNKLRQSKDLVEKSKKNAGVAVIAIQPQKVNMFDDEARTSITSAKGKGKPNGKSSSIDKKKPTIGAAKA